MMISIDNVSFDVDVHVTTITAITERERESSEFKLLYNMQLWPGQMYMYDVSDGIQKQNFEKKKGKPGKS